MAGEDRARDAALQVAALLSAAGGYLDAFTWIAHGGVFANAQTGNVVLLGVFAAAGRWNEALRHVPPIIAFFAGVFVAQRLRRGTAPVDPHVAARRALAIEIVGLLMVTCLPARVPSLPIVLGVAFVAALQNSSFTKVEGWGYNSVMTTGNLRRTAEALLGGMGSSSDPAAWREAVVFATICLCFAAGAITGGLLTPSLANRAALVPVSALIIAWLLCRPLGRRAKR